MGDPSGLPSSQEGPRPKRQNWTEPSLCNRYEDEINKRTALENEFVVLKKVSGGGEPGRWFFGCQGAGLTQRAETPVDGAVCLALSLSPRMWMLPIWAEWICMAKWTP